MELTSKVSTLCNLRGHAENKRERFFPTPWTPVNYYYAYKYINQLVSMFPIHFARIEKNWRINMDGWCGKQNKTPFIAINSLKELDFAKTNPGLLPHQGKNTVSKCKVVCFNWKTIKHR